MAHDHGEVVVVDPKAGVRLAEGATGVRLRSPKHLTHHEHLMTLDSSEIDPFEIRRKLWVAENPVVKVVHDSAHGRPAANGVVVADGPSRLVAHGVLVLPRIEWWRQACLPCRDPIGKVFERHHRRGEPAASAAAGGPVARRWCPRQPPRRWRGPLTPPLSAPRTPEFTAPANCLKRLVAPVCWRPWRWPQAA